MLKFYCLTTTALLVLGFAYLSQVIYSRFTYPNLIGPKRAIEDCKILDELGAFTEETIEIHQVDHGLKLVEAETMQGAFYGLGFVHAMDRLWQLHFFRLLAQGRLSELLGSQTIQIDKFIHTMGLSRSADYQLKNLEPDERLLLQNYVSGVNKAVAERHSYPLEFYLLWTGFEPFTVRDALTTQSMMMMMCASDWQYELVRTRLAEIYPLEFVERLLPSNGPENMFEFENTFSITDAELEEAGLYQENQGKMQRTPTSNFYLPYTQRKDKLEFPGATAHSFGNSLHGGASNCWAVHGNHTASGKPYLACDPHLTKEMDSLFYVTRLTWNQKDSVTGETFKTYLAGATVVGTYVFSYASTPAGAWGVTALNPDIMDLYVEFTRGGQALADDQNKWEEIETITEEISVRGGESIDFDIRYTRNGVLIPRSLLDGPANDLIPQIASDFLKHNEVNDADTWFSLAYSYDPHFLEKHKIRQPDVAMGKFYKMFTESRTKNITGREAVTQILESVEAPFNFMFALTSSGDIGLVSTGRFPLRKYGAQQGSFAKLGYLSENEWLGLLSREEHPYVINPQKGYVVQANNHVTSNNAKHVIGAAFPFQHRLQRISELLDQAISKPSGATIKDMNDIQVDIVDVQARASLQDMLTCAEKGKGRVPNLDLGLAREVFRDWNFQMASESAAASLFMMWELQMATYAHETKIDSLAARQSLFNPTSSQSSFYKMVSEWAHESSSQWEVCQLTSFLSPNTCQEFMAFTLDQALLNLEKRFGPFQTHGWQYQSLVTMKYRHKPFGQIPVLNYFFSEETPQTGNQRTIDVAVYFMQNGESKNFQFTAGSLIRMVVDLADSGQMQVVMDGGTEKTSPFFSPYRFSQNVLFRAGRYIRLPYTEVEDQIRYKLAQTGETLFLFPGAARELPKKKSGWPFADYI